MNTAEIVFLILSLAVMAFLLIHGQATGRIHPFGQKLRTRPFPRFPSNFTLTPKQEKQLLDWMRERTRSNPLWNGGEASFDTSRTTTKP